MGRDFSYVISLHTNADTIGQSLKVILVHKGFRIFSAEHPLFKHLGFNLVPYLFLFSTFVTLPYIVSDSVSVYIGLQDLPAFNPQYTHITIRAWFILVQATLPKQIFPLNVLRCPSLTYSSLRRYLQLPFVGRTPNIIYLSLFNNEL